jgi:2-isopropylmalate synthase
VRHAETPRIHVFISSSDIHLAHQLHKNKEDVLEMAARPSRGGRVHLGRRVLADGRDALRPPVRVRDREAAIEEGATTINIPDTVGYAIPEEFED